MWTNTQLCVFRRELLKAATEGREWWDKRLVSDFLYRHAFAASTDDGVLTFAEGDWEMTRVLTGLLRVHGLLDERDVKNALLSVLHAYHGKEVLAVKSREEVRDLFACFEAAIPRLSDDAFKSLVESVIKVYQMHAACLEWVDC